MFNELVTAIIIGLLVGTFTGLTPGIHTNTIAVIITSLSAVILQFVSLQALVAFIISMSIVHTFVDAIPSIFLGAPDEAQALSVLPGHKMLLNGEGYNALKLTVIGSFFSLIISVLLIPLLIPLVKILHPLIKDYIGWMLLVISIFMILKDKTRFWNLIMFLMSGTLGLITLNTPNINNVLFPLLSGLFGCSLLIISLKDKTKIPTQDLTKKLEISKSTIVKSTIGATIGGFFASFLPGLGSSQTAVIVQQFLKKIGDRGFLVMIGGINTVNMALSIVTLYALDRARNGSIVAISKIVEGFDKQLLIISICAIMITGGIAVPLTLKLARGFSKIITKVNYQHVVLGVLTFITTLVIYFSGIIGLLILIVSTSIGIVASARGIAKNHLMGCLILPVILFFLL